MFSTSTHRQYWIFESQDKLNQLRSATNENFKNKFYKFCNESVSGMVFSIENWGDKFDFSLLFKVNKGNSQNTKGSIEQVLSELLSFEEEHELVREAEYELTLFCATFKIDSNNELSQLPFSVIVSFYLKCAVSCTETYYF